MMPKPVSSAMVPLRNISDETASEWVEKASKHKSKHKSKDKKKKHKKEKKKKKKSKHKSSSSSRAAEDSDSDSDSDDGVRLSAFPVWVSTTKCVDGGLMPRFLWGCLLSIWANSFKTGFARKAGMPTTVPHA